MSPPNGAAPCTPDKDRLRPPSPPPLDDLEVVVPPDGGWGWVVVFASFMCNMVVDGIIFSFGAFLRPVADAFGVTEAQVALVGSLMSGFYLIAGPFVSAVANRFGFRLVAVAGSILGAAAFALSYFAASVEYLCVTFGVLGGIGFGFIYVPSVVTVGFYFEKWRALATGIAVCGSGIGTFLFAPISASLIKHLGWREALLCQGAIVFCCLFFGLLYRPLKPKKISEIKEEQEEETEMNMALAPESLEAVKDNVSCHTSQNSVNRVIGANNNASYPRISDIYRTISNNIPQQKVVDMSCYEKRLSVPFINDEKTKEVEGKECLLDKTSNPVIVPKSTRRGSVGPEVNRPMYRDDIFFSASLTRLPQYTSRTSIAYNLSVTRLPTKADIEEEKEGSFRLCSEATKRTLNTMLDLSLFKSPSFLLLAVGGFFTMMGFYVPFMFLAERARLSGMDADSAVFLVSAIGIANTVGRVLCGVLSSFPGVNALFVTNTALTVGGIATIFSGFSMGPEFQFTYTAIFGLSISCFASLRSIIVVDLLGLENLTNAFGLLLLFQGVAAAIGAPLAGCFKGATGSYDASFYLSGSLLLASAIMCYPLNCINRWEMKRKCKEVDRSVPI